MVSQPVKAVILVFPITESYEQKRREEDRRIATEGQHPIDPTIFWMKQTVRYVLIPSQPTLIHVVRAKISNACGTMALLHALINVRLTPRDVRLSHSILSPLSPT